MRRRPGLRPSRAPRHRAPRSAHARAPLGRIGLAAALLASWLAWVGPTAPAAAATLNVCPSGCPYTTIQSAINAATAGDTIVVAAGTYIEDLTIDRQLTIRGPNFGVAAADVTTGDLTTRLAEATVVGASSAGTSVTADGVVIDGMRFVRPSAAAQSTHVTLIRGMKGGIHTTVKNSNFSLAGEAFTRGCGAAISSGSGLVDLATRFTIIGNHFEGQYQSLATGAPSTCINQNASRIVYLDSASAGSVIQGNSFLNTDHIYATDSADDVRISSNRFEGGTAINLGAVSDAVIEGNRFVALAGQGVLMDLSVRTKIRDNWFLSSTSNATSDYIRADGTTDVVITGNTFDKAFWKETWYWTMLIGYPKASTGTLVTNNRFTANTAAAIWNCTANGTRFNNNYIASGGKDVSSPLNGTADYVARNGSAASCSGKALDARENYWTPGAGALGFQTTSPATTDRSADLSSGASLPLSPGFWPAPVPVETFTKTVSTTSDAPPLVAAVDLGEGNTIQAILDFGEITLTGPVSVSAGTTPADGSVSFGSNSVINISFTGTFTPPVKVCLTYDDSTFPPGYTPALWHHTGGTWSMLETASLDTVGKVVCAYTNSFSDFGVGVALDAVEGCEVADGVLSVTVPEDGGVTLARAGSTVTVDFAPGAMCSDSPVPIGRVSGAGEVRTIAILGGDGDETVTFENATTSGWGRNSANNLLRIIDLGGGTDDLVVLEGTGSADTITVAAFATYLGVDAFRLDGGAGNDILTGSPIDDELLGGLGDDVLRGGAGADTLRGGAGGDRLIGEAGDDTLVGGPSDTAADSFDGGFGTDTLSYDEAAYAEAKTGGGGVSLSLALRGVVQSTGAAGFDVVVDLIERLVGSGGADALVGNNLANRILSGPGNDTVLGGNGDDSLDGQAGTNSIEGQRGRDHCTSTGGADAAGFPKTCELS